MLSVPKSRVTIDYVNTVGGASEKKELPLRLLMVGDYTFKERDPDDVLAEREKIQINQRNFNEVMKKQDLGLDLNVPNRLAAEEGLSRFDFGISRLNEKGLRQFKSKWGAHETPVHFEYIVGSGPESRSHSLPLSLASLAIRYGPPICCRAIGSLFYRYSP